VIDLNSALITAVGVLSATNAYWAKSWKNSMEKRLDKVDEILTKHGEGIARIEGRLNSGVMK